MKKALLTASFTWFCLPYTCCTASGQQTGYLGLEVIGNRVVYSRRYTPAEKAGLMPGDEILAIDSQSVEGLGKGAIDQLLTGAAGDQVTISARRGQQQFVVIMAIRDPMPAAAPPDDAPAKECYELGVKQRELGRPNEAKASLSRAISLDKHGDIKRRAEAYILTQLPLYPVPDDALRLNNYGWHLSRSSRNGEAQAIFEQCISKYPKFEWPRNNLAGMYRTQRRFREANKLIDGTLEFHPEYVNAWYERANIREDEGDLKGALACVRKALSLDPDDKRNREKCAKLEALLGK